MKTITLNAAQAAYDNQIPPDDSEYEKKKEQFLIVKEWYLENVTDSYEEAAQLAAKELGFEI